ncbi:MAG: hypothetical protein ACO20I_15985 [bacterium]
MPFLIPDQGEINRLNHKLTLTHQAYYDAKTLPEKEILWHRIQVQKQRLHEIENLMQWAVV